ncbi:LppA family lipoprotein [Mycobacteriaceae bacterium NPDC060252]
MYATSKRSRSRWGVGAAALLAAVLVMSGCGGSDKGPMSAERLREEIAKLAPKGSSEEGYAAAEAAIAEMADRIAALVPGLTWKWHDDGLHWASCLQNMDSDAIWSGDSVLAVTRNTRSALFSGPIPEDVWPAAVKIVEDKARGFGITQWAGNTDVAQNHDIVIHDNDYNPDPNNQWTNSFEIGTRVVARLAGSVGCRLWQKTLDRYQSEQGNPPASGTR